MDRMPCFNTTNKYKKMKQIYFSPELEVIKIDRMVLLSASPDPDTTDPVPIVEDPTDEDTDW